MEGRGQMSTMKELRKVFEAGYETGKTAFHPCTLSAEDGELNVPGVTYRRWLIGQLLLGAVPPIWESRFDNDRVADSIVSLVDAIIKRERQQ